MIELSKIRIDGGTQARVELNQDAVADYAEAYKSGVAMPAVTVFYDGSTYWLADGFHRFFGAKQAGLTSIFEDIIPGTQREAVLFSLTANSKHGLRRTNADKRKAVETLLADAEWAKWSDSEIGKACAVDHKTVAAHRPAILGISQDAAVKVVKRGGKTYEQNTANIGKSQPAQEPEYNPDDDALAEAHETVVSLSNENDALKDRIAAGAIVGTEEEKTLAFETIESLRAEVKRLEISLSAVTASRDRYMNENAEMKRQLAAQRRQIDKAMAS